MILGVAFGKDHCRWCWPSTTGGTLISKRSQCGRRYIHVMGTKKKCSHQIWAVLERNGQLVEALGHLSLSRRLLWKRDGNQKGALGSRRGTRGAHFLRQVKSANYYKT